MRDLIIHVVAVLAIALLSVVTIRCEVSLWQHDDTYRWTAESCRAANTQED